ncbi:class F sortase [Spongiactinospora sp. TRM90649]|uniref:class F sortase n=1 Tax=Spongiactinospora sp. TRM90649 TaxID=3031114 RepID=UPI0023F9678B|nr:class F sortase [Spongiactinospora sp. TRM90649]MDF5751585.1 class F sortase [Spongiactinospora sp. TRM90649]
MTTQPPEGGYPQQGGYPYQGHPVPYGTQPPYQQGQPQPVYYQQQPQWREPEQPGRPQGGKVLRSILILAAVAGVVTVVAGLLFMIADPAGYNLTDGRTQLPHKAQPSVDNGLFQAAPTAPPPLPPIQPAPPMQPSTPLRLVVKKLGIDAPIKSLGLAKDGTIQVPPGNDPNLVGWFRHGPTAGEAGPSIMLGHKDTATRSAVFSRLAELRYGDQIEVRRQDGTVAVFTVGGVEQADKRTFPTERVYGDRTNAQLHLITCGGTYNRSTGHYTDNVIVYATLTGSHRGSRTS